MAASLKYKRTPITTPPYQVPSVDVDPDPPIFSLVTTFKAHILPWRRLYSSFDVIRMCLHTKVLGRSVTWMIRPLDDVSLTDVSRSWAAYRRWDITAATFRNLGFTHTTRTHWPRQNCPGLYSADLSYPITMSVPPLWREGFVRGTHRPWGRFIQGRHRPRHGTSEKFHSETYKLGTPYFACRPSHVKYVIWQKLHIKIHSLKPIYDWKRTVSR